MVFLSTIPKLFFNVISAAEIGEPGTEFDFIFLLCVCVCVYVFRLTVTPSLSWWFSVLPTPFLEGGCSSSTLSMALEGEGKLKRGEKLAANSMTLYIVCIRHCMCVYVCVGGV